MLLVATDLACDVRIVEVAKAGPVQPEPAGRPARDGCRILAVLDWTDVELVFHLHSRVDGFFLADDPIDDLPRAIEAVAADGMWLSPRLARWLLSRRGLGSGLAFGVHLGELTDREREILACVARAANNADIARDLFISISTVKYHVSNLLRKLGCRDRASLMALANGLDPVLATRPVARPKTPPGAASKDWSVV